ncbi:unknown protein [Simkania negevensis Z]|uniref:Uncharacterized protein n=1 Tax=Simkania negevensis (strain ATCC VR-1471 / DSM 27360 / Z) TaxID=331113 RepID=F8L4S1_SIMNZ|nr:unknown protein [Simkania negevensis Z]
MKELSNSFLLKALALRKLQQTLHTRGVRQESTMRQRHETLSDVLEGSFLL